MTIPWMYTKALLYSIKALKRCPITTKIRHNTSSCLSLIFNLALTTNMTMCVNEWNQLDLSVGLLSLTLSARGALFVVR